MNKQLFLITILTVLSVFASSCAPSQSVIPTGAPSTSTALPTTIPSPTTAPTNIPESTQTWTATPDVSGAIRVPEDQPTIQAGIDAAQDGDVVLVAPGLYLENIT